MSEPQVSKSSSDGDAAPTALEPSTHIDLPGGKGLTFSEADLIAKRSAVRLIVLAGTAKSGKTTLLSTLPLLFQQGPFAGFLFAGSETLVGFEERNYYVAVDSNLIEPTTERTVRSEMLHLQTRDEKKSGHVIDMLLCDMSGEEFREAKDSMDACKGMTILLRADTLVLLVDGEKLAEKATRQRAKNDSLTLLRNALDGGMIRPTTIIDLIVTKWDKVLANQQSAEIVEFVKHVESVATQLCKDRVNKLRFGRIAAHPTEGDLPLGSGMKELFPLWVQHTAETSGILSGTPRPTTEFDCFASRQAELGKGVST